MGRLLGAGLMIAAVGIFAAPAFAAGAIQAVPPAPNGQIVLATDCGCGGGGGSPDILDDLLEDLGGALTGLLDHLI